jgi:ABC-type lipoprotein export system ATPase subunit
MIKLENVARVYQMGQTLVQALRGLNLEIADGEFVAIMGPSGSGKSTLLHLIGGLDLPNTGRVLLGDLDIAQQNGNQLAELRGKKVGFVFQTFNLVPTLSALKNVELPMIFQKVPRKERYEKARRLLRASGLGGSAASQALRTLRGRVPAGGYRPCARQQSPDSFGRRAHGQPRRRIRRTDHADIKETQRRAEDDDHRRDP